PVAVPVGLNKCYKTEEVERLFQAAAKLRGRFLFGCHRGQLMLALVSLMYDTGLRPCDVRTLKLAPLLETGRMVIHQQKTGVPIVIDLRPETLDLLRNT